VMAHCRPMPSVSVPLADAAGLVLAHDLIASLDLPPFSQSAMDGYALAGHGPFPVGTRFRVVGEVKAGDGGGLRLHTGEAARIFTGGAIPEGAGTVVMQEHAHQDGLLLVLDTPVGADMHIRHRAEQLKQGEVALESGTVLVPGALGFLAGLGVGEVPVIPRPRVALVNSGNELVSPGSPLAHGQVYDSNSVGIAAALGAAGYTVASREVVPDDPDATDAAMQRALSAADALLITGGVSVGTHDHVPGSLERIGVQRVFHKVHQKPGKPLWFGMAGSRPVFGFPGNPAAALTCLYHYALPALAALAGRSDARPTLQRQRLLSSWPKRDDKTHLLKARSNTDGVELLQGQGSDMLRAFASANALVILGGPARTLDMGEEVEVMRLP